MSVPQGSITIVGLGPGDPTLRTVGTQRALDQADVIVLRTRIHPGLDDLAGDPRVSDCDDLYQTADRFHDLYAAIARRILERAQAGREVVYAVPGHPRFAERSVALIEEEAAHASIPITVLDAVSFVDTSLGSLRRDPIEQGLQIVDAEQLSVTLDAEPFAAGSLGIDPARPLLVAQIYNAELAAAVKLALTRLYPEDHHVTLLHAAGIPEASSRTGVPLHLLDRQNPDHLTTLWVPPLGALEAARSPQTLARIVAHLRAPGGCPWDREQTHLTMRGAILEEAHETVEAIDNEDPDALAEELGDLLLLVAMHAQMAEEAGEFRIEDVFEAINRKLIRRHPHVFGEVQADTPDAVIATWEGVKAAERATKGPVDVAEPDRYSRLPRSMPATRKAIELLAPRATLTAPAAPEAGEALLDAILDLIGQGIDPETALEATLRQRANGPSDQLDLLTVTTPNDTKKGHKEG